MYIYIILLLSIIFLKKLFNDSRKEKILYLITVGVLFVFVSGLRDYSVGMDTEMYSRSYDLICSFGKPIIKEMRYETGFSYLMLCSSFLSNDFTFFLFICSIFITFSHFFFIYRNSKNLCLSLCLYVLLNRFFINMNSLRQVIAISIVLISFELLKKDKRKLINIVLYSAIVFFASLFHKSALLMLLLVPVFLIKKYTKFSFLIYLFLSLLLGVIMTKSGNFIIDKIDLYSQYSDSDYADSSMLGAIINYLAVVIPISLCLVLNKEDNVENNRLLHISSIGLLFFGCALGSSIFGRMGYYFSVFLLPLISNCFGKIVVTRNIKGFLKGTYMIYIVIMFFVIMIFRPDWFGCTNYLFFWSA
jgi:hypothetical protein